MIRGAACGLVFMLLSSAGAQEGKFTIKTEAAAAPKEVAEPIQKLLGAQASKLYGAGGKLVCTVWFRSEIPVDATPDQLKNGLTYREVKQSEIFGVVRFDADYRDYRKQKVKAGTYTLRLGYQPTDGDHAGASEFQDFLLVLDAAKDTKTEPMDAKSLIDASAKSIASGHPGVFMLFPNVKPGQTPALAAMPKNHWVLQSKADATSGGKKTGATLGIGLTLVGEAD
jgi:hypothetical protein